MSIKTPCTQGSANPININAGILQFPIVSISSLKMKGKKLLGEVQICFGP